MPLEKSWRVLPNIQSTAPRFNVDIQISAIQNVDKINKNANKINKNADKINKNVDKINKNADKMNKNVDKINKNVDKINKNAMSLAPFCITDPTLQTNLGTRR
jgi:methyl-accepting chemotaxis protein